MFKLYNEISRTFNEYLLIPNLSTPLCMPEKIDLTTPITRFRPGEAHVRLNIPFVSAIMQAVSDHKLAISLARCGGLSFIYGAQTIDSQAEMIRKVKKFKSGFVVCDSYLSPEHTLNEILRLKEDTGHTTIAVTSNGKSDGTLTGLITSRDYRISRDPLDKKVCDIMTPFESLITGRDGISLNEANDLIWANKLNCLPIVNENQQLVHMVFRKDYEAHKENPFELLDEKKSLLVGAGINTYDYQDRVPALLEAGADILCLDSSDGYSTWQYDAITYIKSNFPKAYIGAGNVVDAEGFRYLADAGADFVKVGIGGGSICITREQKGIGRGQATAILEVASARDKYMEETGIYIPICSDGGIVYDNHIAIALAMGADFVMMGRYFARFDESPGKKLKRGNEYVKEYWGEGSDRAKNWQRYSMSASKDTHFEEGVDSYVPYAGALKDNLSVTISKIKSTMSSCGAASIEEFQKKARITLVSPMSIREGGAHDIILKNKDY